VIPDAKQLSVDQFDAFDKSGHSELVGLPERHRRLLQEAISDDLTFDLAEADAGAVRIGGRLLFSSSEDVHKSERREEVENDEEEDKNKDGGEDSEKKYITKIYYDFTRTATLDVEFEIIDSAGDIIASSKIKLKDSSTARDESLYYAKQRVSSENSLWEDLMSMSVYEVMRRIKINHTNENRYFEKVKDNKQFKMANKAASKGDWNYALSIWETEADSSTSVKAASLYNKSIYYESIGDLNSATALMEEAVQLGLNSRYTERYQELKNLIEEARIIEENY
jgi:hypothetical protein